MEPAVKQDLQFASRQGTILSIRVNRTTYGQGGYRSPELYPSQYISMYGGAAVAGVVLGMLIWKCFQLRKGQSSMIRSLKEKLNTDIDCTANCAMAGLECQVGFREQRPTASDPKAVDLFRLPVIGKSSRNGSNPAGKKESSEALADSDDDETAVSNSSTGASESVTESVATWNTDVAAKRAIDTDFCPPPTMKDFIDIEAVNGKVKQAEASSSGTSSDAIENKQNAEALVLIKDDNEIETIHDEQQPVAINRTRSC